MLLLLLLLLLRLLLLLILLILLLIIMIIIIRIIISIISIISIHLQYAINNNLGAEPQGDGTGRLQHLRGAPGLRGGPIV